jgi:hypothetical protein
MASDSTPWAHKPKRRGFEPRTLVRVWRLPVRRLVDLAASVNERWREWRIRSRGRQTGGESAAATAVATCRAKSSSVASASLVPSSRSGQATSDVSYQPRRTPSRLTCSQAHPTELAPLCAAGRFRLATVYAIAVHADLLETVGRPVQALIGLRVGHPLDRARTQGLVPRSRQRKAISFLLSSFLRFYPPELMRAVSASSLVNGVRNDHPRLLEPGATAAAA